MLEFLLAISSVLPAIASAVKYKQIDKKMYPFVYAIWLAVVVELIAFIAIQVKSNNLYSINYNCFTVVSLLLMLWFFVEQKTITSKVGILLFIILMVVKLANFCYIKEFKVFREAYMIDCVLIIYLSIKTLVSQVLFSNTKLFKSTIFLVLISLIILNSFDVLNNILVWVFFISKAVMQKITLIFFIINALCYCLMFYAFLCIPTNRK